MSSLPGSSVVTLLRLFFRHPLIDLHDELGRLGLDEDGDGVKPGSLKPLDGVAADIQDAMLALLGNLLHGCH